MPFCVVKTCKNYASKMRKGDGISYFHFPQDRKRRLLWTSIIAKSRQEENFNPKSFSVVCSQHFSDSDTYLTRTGLRRLKNTAFPTILSKSEGPTSQNKYLNETLEVNISTIDVNKTEFNYDASQMNEIANKRVSTIGNKVLLVSSPEKAFEKSTTTLFVHECEKCPAVSLKMNLEKISKRYNTLKKYLRLSKRKLLLKNKQIDYYKKVIKRLHTENNTLKNALQTQNLFK